jgi:hypothetical protein
MFTIMFSRRTLWPLFGVIKKSGKMPGLRRSSKSIKKTNSLLLLLIRLGGRLIALRLLLWGGVGSARNGGLRGFIGDTLGIGHCNSFLKYRKNIFRYFEQPVLVS